MATGLGESDLVSHSARRGEVRKCIPRFLDSMAYTDTEKSSQIDNERERERERESSKGRKA